MRRKRMLLTMSLLLMILGITQAQTRNVTGIVTSSANGKPVQGVSVKLKGAVAVSTTDEKGFYSIAVSDKSTETLIFSHKEYDEMEVVVIGKTKLDLAMESNVRFNQYGQVVDRVPLLSESRNGVITWESKDGSYRLWTDIRLNIDYTKHFDNYDNTLSASGNAVDAIQLSDGGNVRRARIAFKAQVTDKWYGEFDIDFRDLEIDINDMYLEYSFNEFLSLKAGNFREPFGMMTNTTSRYVSFMERPLSSEMDPSRHVGIGARYFKSRFTSGLGLFTDAVYGVEAKDVRRKIRTGTEASMAVTGRFMGYALNRNHLTLGIGVGGSYRTPEITEDGSNTFRIRVADENRTSQKRFLDTDAIKYVKKIILANAELAFAWNSLRIQSEYKILTLDRGNIYTDINYTGQNRTDAHFNGFYFEVGYFLFGDKANFNYADGEFTRVNPKSKNGTIELAARYSTINLNDDAAEVYGGEGKITSFLVTYWAKSNARVILNAAYVDHDEHATSKYLWKVPAAGFDYWWVGTRIEIDF
jgi:phosphate-selective porin OprO and OprP